MELIMKFDLKDIKEDMSDSFWNAHSINWEDSEKPTNGELKDSIKSEIDTWLDELGISFDMKETQAIEQFTENLRSRLNELHKQKSELKGILWQQDKVKDVLWDFISEKDFSKVQERILEVEKNHNPT
jgi:hypothetical protein